jgi:hypothetical protein
MIFAGATAMAPRCDANRGTIDDSRSLKGRKPRGKSGREMVVSQLKRSYLFAEGYFRKSPLPETACLLRRNSFERSLARAYLVDLGALRTTRRRESAPRLQVLAGIADGLHQMIFILTFVSFAAFCSNYLRYLLSSCLLTAARRIGSAFSREAQSAIERTSVPFRMRPTRPASTSPGPSSRNRLHPS